MTIREDARKDSSRTLYEDKRYFIGVSGKEIDSHNVVVDEAYVFLQRGILRDMARAENAREIRKTLENIGARSLLAEVEAKKIPLEELGWAFAKAWMEEDLSIYRSD